MTNNEASPSRIIMCADCNTVLADAAINHDCAAQRRANRKAQRAILIRVECQECGKRWATTNPDPECPRCGGCDIYPAEVHA